MSKMNGGMVYRNISRIFVAYAATFSIVKYFMEDWRCENHYKDLRKNIKNT